MLQILIFNNLEISGFINPYIYIIVIMAVPFGVSTSMLMTIAFVTGLSIDLFCDTPGMHASASVLIGYIRQYILKFIAFSDAYKDDEMPSVKSYGLNWFVKYTVLMVSAHHVMLFIVEQFDTFFFWPTILRIILSIVTSSLLILLSQMIIPTTTSRSLD